MITDKSETSPEKKNNKKITVLAFLILYFSNDTLLFGTNENRAFFIFHIFALLCIFCWLVLDKSLQSDGCRHCVSIPQNMCFSLLALCVMALLTMLFNYDFSVKYGYQIFMFLFAMLVVIRIQFMDFIEGYNRAMFLLASASIIAMIITAVIPSVIVYLPSLTNANGYVFRFYGFGFLEGTTLIMQRNYGIFREPGVYAIFLLFAIIFELFILETKKTKRILLYIIAMFFTYSTMSYLTIPLVLAVYFFKIVSNNNSSVKNPSLFKILAILMVLIFIIGATGNFDRVFGVVFNKMFTENSSRDSRSSAIFANIDLMMRNPICGNGFTFVENNFALYSQKYSNYGGHNTNTLLKILSVYGVPYCFVLVYSLYRFFKKRNGVFISFALLIVVAVMLSNEDLIVNIIIYIFAFYGMKPYIEYSKFNSLTNDI